MSFVLILLIAACGRPAEPGKPRIALVMKSLANEFFLTMEQGARAHQASHSGQYELLANGIRDELDVARQVELVEQMIGQQVDAIVIAPADSRSLVDVCKRAVDAGIVVVNIDNRFDAATLAQRNLRIPFVGPDNRRGARLAGEHVASRLKPGDKVAIIEGAPGAFNAVQRRLGFEDAVKAAGLVVAVSQSGNWETEKANQVVAAALIEQPDLRAILCANDSMALGAVAAVKAAGRSGQVHVVGFDNISAVRRLLADGTILCTVDQHAGQLAVYGIEYALSMIGKGVAPEDKETPIDLITGGKVASGQWPDDAALGMRRYRGRGSLTLSYPWPWTCSCSCTCSWT